MDIERLKPLSQENFSIGQVDFQIRPLSAPDQFSLLEYVRNELVRVELSPAFINLFLGGFEGLTSDELLLRLITGFLSLSPRAMATIKGKLFEHVGWRSTEMNVPQYSELVGVEEMAFGQLGPGAIYEVIIRGLAVNFIVSSAETITRLGALIPAIPSAQVGTSPEATDSLDPGTDTI